MAPVAAVARSDDVALPRSPRVYDALDRWGARVRAWLAGESPVENPVAPTAAPTPRDVYVYFDNDVKVAAPFDAIALAERVD